MNDPAKSPFKASPFSLVADTSTASCWAGQTSVLNRLERLCRAWNNRSDSSLDLMWANLGAGKTHALFYLKHLLETKFSGKPESIVVFAEIPEDLGRFVELYRRIANALPLSELAQLGVAGEANELSPSLYRACRALAFGDQDAKKLAVDWLAGGRPGLRELKSITGIEARIESDMAAEQILSELLQLASTHNKRVVILLDEFQRVGNFSQRAREGVLSHLRSLFSKRPTHLSVLMAVGSRIEKTAIGLLPPELRTIMGMRPSISLPEMTEEDAEQFVMQRLTWFRPPGYSGPAEYPFSNEQIRFTISYLVKNAKQRLIPRTVLQVLGIVYDEIEAEGGGTFSENQLKLLLDSLRWDES